MSEFIAYLTTACLWTLLGLAVLFVFTRERRTYKRHHRRGMSR